MGQKVGDQVRARCSAGLPPELTCGRRGKAVLPRATRRKAVPRYSPSCSRPRFGGAFSLRALWLKRHAEAIALWRWLQLTPWSAARFRRADRSSFCAGLFISCPIILSLNAVGQWWLASLVSV